MASFKDIPRVPAVSCSAALPKPASLEHFDTSSSDRRRHGPVFLQVSILAFGILPLEAFPLDFFPSELSLWIFSHWSCPFGIVPLSFPMRILSLALSYWTFPLEFSQTPFTLLDFSIGVSPWEVCLWIFVWVLSLGVSHCKLV